MPLFNHDLLRTVRLDLGMTQDEAAAALEVDVRTYRRYESGAVNTAGAFEVRSAARRTLLRRMCTEFGIADESAWLIAQSTPADTPARYRPHYAHPLPPARYFHGREGALASLSAWLDDTNGARVLTVLGLGGTGKTALVEHFLATRARAHDAGVFVWSFYDDARSEALLDAALAYFARDERGGEGGPLDRLLTALRKGETRHLLVLDGVESVQSEGHDDARAAGEVEDPVIRRLVRSIAAGVGETRLLLSSRVRVADLAPWEGTGARTLTLDPLDASEARAVLRAWGARGNDAALAPLVERAGGHALSIAVLGSYVAGVLEGDPARAAPMDPARHAGDDPLARKLADVLGAYANALAPEERDLLARLALFANGVDAALLAEISDARNERVVLERLARLTRLGLLTRGDRGRYAAHPFVREHFKTLLGVPAERIHEAARTVFAAQLKGRPAGYVDDPGTLDRYEALLEHTLRAGHASEAFGVYARGMGGFDQLGLRLGAMTRGLRILSLFGDEGRPDRPRADLPVQWRAGVAYDTGLFAGALGDLALAQRCYDAHLRAIDTLDPEAAAPLRAMGLRTRGYTHWLAGRFDRARADLHTSIALAREHQLPSHCVRGLALLAAVEHERGDAHAADEALAMMRAIDPSPPTARRALWEAELRLARGQREEARALTERAHAFCAARQWTGHVAHARVVLGEIDPADPAARGHLECARAWVAQSGEVEMALRGYQLATRVALANGRTAEAAREARAGLERAVSEGYLGFAVRLGTSLARALAEAGDAEGAQREARNAEERANACGAVHGANGARAVR